jgi:hypothetical protein
VNSDVRFLSLILLRKTQNLVWDDYPELMSLVSGKIAQNFLNAANYSFVPAPAPIPQTGNI